MTPERMAQIHTAAFVHERGWSATEFAEMVAKPHITAFTATGGFALTQTVAGETELLTLAVSPDHQRQGIAQALIEHWLSALHTQADKAFLEVAADNHAALSLYAKAGFSHGGLRKAYYARAIGPAIDAVLMTRVLNQGR
jgi:ribosomal-protein-alanine N-acetyltransferase